MVKKFRLDSFGYEVEIGKFARQADAAVWIKQGGTVVLSTVVSAPTKDFPGFLPLTVDYREQFAAAGKIPGGYFKREGRSTDREVLLSRVIDRACRPLFPANYFNQVQLLSTVYSVDKKNLPGPLALVASSLALTLSKIPFMGPVGSVDVVRLDGSWIVGASYEDSLKADARMTFAGTEEGINMVEGTTQEISEKEFLDAMFLAHGKIKEQVIWQKEIAAEVGQAKEEIADPYAWATWEQRVNEFLTDEHVRSVYKNDKVERNASIQALRDAFNVQYKQELEDKKIPSNVIEYIFDDTLKAKITELIFTLNKRVDGRAYEQIRQITTEVGLLPFTHGSALFTRGRTQALVTATLGSGEDEQKLETIMEDITANGRFMLHYNFPPFSVGEAKPLRGPGRREVGHGALAASALKNQLPDAAAFPYTIRIVADMLESDGSTSMATVCGSTMALMQAGVPIKNMVSGIAMGLLKSDSDSFTVLSDISGFEDAFGLMDFKVAGTANGITAIQMDIKYKGGLKREIFEVALEQAKRGRLHILGEMQKCMSVPNKELSELVPKFVTMNIAVDKIGAIIGTGGKTIREIIEKTGTTIDIEDDGLVKIFGKTGEGIDAAIAWIKILSGQIDAGMTFEGKIRRIVEFGMFVELVPGKDGLVHVSNIPQQHQRSFANDYQLDQVVKVEVLEYDDATGRVRLRIIQ
ncbi:MAG: polyribonucleotide nucleotidyltransferase [Candidatus Dependentiae bacterium]|nr:polyribonucleotide nucleotidyltransferase [Candidatus Dependentiae bacterium]